MCGRYASTKTAVDIAREFRAVDATGEDAPGPDYNVAPTKPILAVVQRHPRDAEGNPDLDRTERSVRVMRWGLVPSWAKDPSVGARMINARSETAAEKPAFRTALAGRRCVLPAEGWYEWRREGAVAGGKPTKQPYFITGTDGASLAMAGLWEFWRTPDGEPLVTAAVLTTDAVGPMAEIHERMPLLLPPGGWDSWLDPDAPPPAELLRPPAGPYRALVERLELRPVSSRVNNARNEGPELMERVEVEAPPWQPEPSRPPRSRAQVAETLTLDLET